MKNIWCTRFFPLKAQLVNVMFTFFATSIIFFVLSETNDNRAARACINDEFLKEIFVMQYVYEVKKQNIVKYFQKGI